MTKCGPHPWQGTTRENGATYILLFLPCPQIPASFSTLFPFLSQHMYLSDFLSSPCSVIVVVGFIGDEQQRVVQGSSNKSSVQDERI